jgi:Tol biopolymer transport system component
MNSSKHAAAKCLTTDGRLKTDPVFLPGGGTLVYSVQEKSTQLSLMRLTVASGAVERLHPQALTTEFEPTFTADGRYFAFVQLFGNLKLNLVIRDTQAKDANDALYSPEGGFAGVRRPSIAPDGSKVVFALPARGGQPIAAVNLQGKEQRILTSGGFNAGPAFAPDGKSIAFASSRGGAFDIYVMNADGGDVRRLARSPGMSLRPAWAPDGQRIAFTSNRDGNYQIYVMNADGTEQRRVTESTERDDYPTWHFEGKHIVFVGERDGKSDLYQIEVPK